MEDQVPMKKTSGIIRSKTILTSKIQNKKMSLDEDQQFEDDQNYPNQTLKQSKGSNEIWKNIGIDNALDNTHSRELKTNVSNQIKKKLGSEKYEIN